MKQKQTKAHCSHVHVVGDDRVSAFTTLQPIHFPRVARGKVPSVFGVGRVICRFVASRQDAGNNVSRSVPSHGAADRCTRRKLAWFPSEDLTLRQWPQDFPAKNNHTRCSLAHREYALVLAGSARRETNIIRPVRGCPYDLPSPASCSGVQREETSLLGKRGLFLRTSECARLGEAVLSHTHSALGQLWVARARVHGGCGKVLTGPRLQFGSGSLGSGIQNGPSSRHGNNWYVLRSRSP